MVVAQDNLRAGFHSRIAIRQKIADAKKVSLKDGKTDFGYGRGNRIELRIITCVHKIPRKYSVRHEFCDWFNRANYAL